MKYIFLVNRFSLKDNTNDVIARILTVADELKLDYEVEVNSNHVSTEDILAKYKKSRNIIICLGGDGTINRTLNSIANTKNVLGYIPFGTGNDFYRSNQELLSDGINKIDLVRINYKYFINVACFGIDADIANTDELIHSSIIPKSQRYNISIINHFLKYKARHMKVLVDGKEYESDYTTIAVCNARYYGGGYKIGTNAELDDGLADVYLINDLPKLKMASLILGMKKGKHETDSNVSLIRTKKLTIESPEEFECNIDGDKLKDKKFEIEVIPNGIEVYYDQHLIDEIKKVKMKKKQ